MCLKCILPLTQKEIVSVKMAKDYNAFVHNVLKCVAFGTESIESVNIIAPMLLVKVWGLGYNIYKFGSFIL